MRKGFFFELIGRAAPTLVINGYFAIIPPLWPGTATFFSAGAKRAFVDNLYNLNARGESLRQKEKRARARYPLGRARKLRQQSLSLSLSGRAFSREFSKRVQKNELECATAWHKNAILSEAFIYFFPPLLPLLFFFFLSSRSRTRPEAV